MQSIEDLIKASQGEISDDESAQAKFQKKQAEIKVKEEERQAQSMADGRGIPYVNFFGFPIGPEALALVKEEVARELNVVCFFYDGENIRLGSVTPDDPKVMELLDKLNTEYHTQGNVYLISQHSLEYAFKLYKMLPKVRKFIAGVEIKEEDLLKFEKEISEYRQLNERINDVSTSDVITIILATALKTGASDVHVEAEEDGIAIRLRIDGVLHEAAVMEKSKWKKIISRLKILAKVKINVDNKPQDGRFSIFVHGGKVDVRTSFLPTSFGESVVMRLLKSEAANLQFEDLGLLPAAYEILEQEIKKPNGMILTTGPTGSGKTTTLYSILNKLNDPETKIITLENPIEYQLKGISQSQVDPSKDYTFSKGLRSILRQDPDIVMVGEIRDLETAEIAIQASLTGHLVLSTLHTNDASGVIPRLIDMGVKSHFLSPSINAVVGQRLVRKLCDHCKQEHVLSESEKEQVEKILAVVSPKANVEIPSALPTIYKAKEGGCEVCSGIGYKGRIGIYEIFTMSDNIKQLTADNAPAFKILEQAIENGMLTMLQDGVIKTMKGVTSLDEVYRVIGKFDYIDTLYDVVVSQTIGRGMKIDETVMAEAGVLAKDLTKSDQAINKIAPKQMLAMVMALGIVAEAGDVHIEPTDAGVKVRYRIDGILHDIALLSKEHYIQLISNIKILMGVPTNVHKPTIDGRFSIKIKDRKIDNRVSIISGGYGETVVIRILASSASALKMEELGIGDSALTAIRNSMKKTKGIIVNTGPTGSGKTTTLYSILNELNSSDVKIITIEDPIEYQLEGVMQTQINTDEGYTFAAALRSLMRQNPNIIMVGEIRDDETAKISMEAAMTGHLVLSTIHANSASGAISRFVSLGADRQMLANAIEATMGQRLVRKICEKCKAEYAPDNASLLEVKKILDSISPKSGIEIPKELKFYKGTGCEQCNGLGYKGRLGIYEIITMTPAIQKIIQAANVTDYDIEEAARQEGMVLIIQDGILKALRGQTTVEEVFRVAK